MKNQQIISQSSGIKLITIGIAIDDSGMAFASIEKIAINAKIILIERNDGPILQRRESHLCFVRLSPTISLIRRQHINAMLTEAFDDRR